MIVRKQDFVDGVKCLGKFVICFCPGMVFRHIGPIRDHQLISFTPVEECVGSSREVRKIFKRFVIEGGLNLVWSQQPSRVMLMAKISFLIGLFCPPFMYHCL